MAVKEEKPISMPEVAALAGEGEKADAIKKFISGFVKMSVEKALEMKEELRALDLIKLKEMHLVKIIDFVPTDAIELNKILFDVSLDQDEVNKVLDVTRKY